MDFPGNLPAASLVIMRTRAALTTVENARGGVENAGIKFENSPVHPPITAEISRILQFYDNNTESSYNKVSICFFTKGLKLIE